MFLDNLREEDFGVLRGSLESGRQSPQSFSGMLILGIFLQALMFFLVYVVLGYDSNYPYQNSILFIHLTITILIIIMSAIFSVPTVYKKMEKFQYFVSIVVSQNLFGVYSYLITLFTLGHSNASTRSLLFATLITFTLGCLIFIMTFVRFYRLLKQGEYRKGSKKDKNRMYFEKKSLVPYAVVGGLGIFYLIQFISKNLRSIEFDSIFMGTLGLIIFFTMLFVLPEQLVILYCKKRFKSFNFNKEGNIYPMGSGEKVG
ncbi:hypothetical protein [Gracilibacillus saliphilus]|uniref:hypothetical protein n=1 Tax=Gracilibacillus saliphilus TaxID=543890 RepID=UPI0013D1191A|nr:hypothetical protein [Gracilibacillus saliphilus]